MNQEQAKQEFTRGAIHPHCPECGNRALQILGTKQTVGADRKNHLVKTYGCRSCNTSFNAWIDG
jgi:hypothetical protein